MTEPRIASLEAEVAELRAIVSRLSAELESVTPAQRSDGPHSRRDLLKLAGGVAAGAAGGLLFSGASPAAATNGDPLLVGAQATPTAGSVEITGLDYTSAGLYYTPAPRPVFAVTDDAAVGVSAAILGVATKNNVVGVAGVGGFYDLLAAGSGVIGMAPALPVGPPATGEWINGDLIEDEAGNLFVCVQTGRPGLWRKLAGPASAGAFHAISPQRVSRLSRQEAGSWPTAPSALSRLVGPLAGTPVVPAGATAVSITLTVTETEGDGGFLAVRPSATPYAGTSSINSFGPNQNIATTVFSLLGGDRLLHRARRRQLDAFRRRRDGLLPVARADRVRPGG